MIFLCVLCQEYWQTIPDQPPGSQIKYQNKLPNLHRPWKFYLVQDCVLALTSEKHSFSCYRMESVYLLSRQIGQRLISTSPAYWYCKKIFLNTVQIVLTNYIYIYMIRKYLLLFQIKMRQNCC